MTAEEMQIRKNIFLAGYKSCENGWNIQKAEKWFDKTYPFLPSDGTEEKVFNKFCTLVNKDYGEYIIKDRKGFIKAMHEFAASKAGQSNIRNILIDFCKEYKAYYHTMIHLGMVEATDYKKFIDEYLNSIQ